jgi:hypothetical protein
MTRKQIDEATSLIDSFSPQQPSAAGTSTFSLLQSH